MPGYIHSYGGPDCHYVDQTFNSQIATIPDKLTYARCVNYLYQDQSDIIWLKIGITVTILAFLIGLFMGFKKYFFALYRHNRDGGDLLAYPFFGAIFGMVVVTVPYGIYKGVEYILNN